MKNINYLIFIFCFIPNFYAYSNKKLDSFFEQLKNHNYNVARNIAQELSDEPYGPSLNLLLSTISKKEIHKKNVIITKNEALETRFIKHLLIGYNNTLQEKQSSLKAYINFSKALKISKAFNSTELKKVALIAILELFKREIFIGGKQYLPYLEEFIELKTDLTDEVLIILYRLTFFSKGDAKLSIHDLYNQSFYQLDSIFKVLPKNHNFRPIYYFEKGIFNKINKDYSKSIYFFNKTISLSKQKDFLKNLECSANWQIADVNMKMNKIDTAKEIIRNPNGCRQRLKDSFYDYRLFSRILAKEKKFDSAYQFLNESLKIEYELGYKNNTLESSILTVQNQTDKLKIDKIELNNKRQNNQNIAIGLGGSLFLGSIIAILVYRNTKRKQRIAEQQREIEIQKTEKLLKEQELTAIDAMISGQEKERQRLANDLHDNLGSTLATVKLHFDHLKNNRNNPNIENVEELYSKTNNLLDEAYQKVRTIAHEKNSGVMANQGLLPAIKKLAAKASNGDQLQIEVQDYGLEERLDNSLEISIFRMIQELITNTIKHANASEINISLTNHDSLLNIIVEDNGKGFNAKVLPEKDGMGLKSIEKRIEHLEGTFEIDSTVGKGTNIIINIPI
ncbi:sensor histidine kinase [Aquimarina sp. 433]